MPNHVASGSRAGCNSGMAGERVMGWELQVEKYLEGPLNDIVLHFQHKKSSHSVDTKCPICIRRMFFNMWLDLVNPVDLDGKKLFTRRSWILAGEAAHVFMPSRGYAEMYDIDKENVFNIKNNVLYVFGKKVKSVSLGRSPMPVMYEGEKEPSETDVHLQAGFTECHYRLYPEVTYEPSDIGIILPWVAYQVFDKALQVFLGNNSIWDLYKRWNGNGIAIEESNLFMRENVLNKIQDMDFNIDKEEMWAWAAANITAELSCYLFSRNGGEDIADILRLKPLFQHLVERDSVHSAFDFFNRTPSVGHGSTDDKLYQELNNKCLL